MCIIIGQIEILITFISCAADWPISVLTLCVYYSGILDNDFVAQCTKIRRLLYEHLLLHCKMVVLVSFNVVYSNGCNVWKGTDVAKLYTYLKGCKPATSFSWMDKLV